MFNKTRPYYSLRAWQLIREERASQIAQQALPAQVDDVVIVVPQVKARLTASGVQINAPHFEGWPLMTGLYNAGQSSDAVQMAATALQALNLARFDQNPFPIFSCLYWPVRVLKVRLRQASHVRLLSAQDAQRLATLLERPAGGQPRPMSLVHGNLHGGNVIMDAERRSLALVDLEMMHLGDPAADFAALWVTHYIAGPQLAGQFFRATAERLPGLLGGDFLPRAGREILVETYLMVYKGRSGGNQDLEQRSLALLKRLLACEHVEGLLMGEDA